MDLEQVYYRLHKLRTSIEFLSFYARPGGPKRCHPHIARSCDDLAADVHMFTDPPNRSIATVLFDLDQKSATTNTTYLIRFSIKKDSMEAKLVGIPISDMPFDPNPHPSLFERAFDY